MAQDHDVIIRTAGPDEAEMIASITRIAFEQFTHRVYPPFRAHSQTPSHVRYEIEVQRFVYGVAVVGGRPAGHVRYRLRPGYMHVSRLAVLPGFRGYGVGRKLMAWVEREAHRLHARILRGEVRTVLRDVLQYYMDIGYRVIGYASLHGVRRCLTLIEKRLPAPVSPPPGSPASTDDEPRSANNDDADWPTDESTDESARVDEAAISPRLLHPAVGKLVGPLAHRSRRMRR